MIYGQINKINLVYGQFWTESFSVVLKKFYDYVDKHVYSANEAILIRDLCIKLDSGDFSFFNIDALNEMVALLCTA